MKFKNPKQRSGWTPVVPVPAVKYLLSDLFLLCWDLSLPKEGMRWSLMSLPTQTNLRFWTESTNWKREIFTLWAVGRRVWEHFPAAAPVRIGAGGYWEHWGTSMGWNMGKINLHLLLKWAFFGGGFTLLPKPPFPVTASPKSTELPGVHHLPRDAGTKDTSLFLLMVVLKKNCCLPRNWVLFFWETGKNC